MFSHMTALWTTKQVLQPDISVEKVFAFHIYPLRLDVSVLDSNYRAANCVINKTLAASAASAASDTRIAIFCGSHVPSIIFGNIEMA